VNAAPKPEFTPPYQVKPDAPNELLVREDVAARLETAPVEGGGAVKAHVVGYGRTAFAPDASYSVRVPFTSFVERVHVGLGDAVNKGDVLATLRSSEVAKLRAELRAAEVSVEAERRTLQRLKQLVSDGTATERERNEAESRLTAATQLLAGLRGQLAAVGVSDTAGDRFVLRAHAAGKLLQRTVDPGELVGPDSPEPAFVIGDPERLWVLASFPERDSTWLREGLPCSAKLHALGGLSVEGTLTRVSRAADRQTRSLEAVCTPTRVDPGLSLSAEMTARVEVAVDANQQLLVPRSAVLLRRDQYVVFVQKSERVLERREVVVGQPLADRIQVVAGLEPHDRVVTSGAVLLDGELDRLL
jgi:cobalt-zinc-cadmium efflux system membrane fusion protein